MKQKRYHIIIDLAKIDRKMLESKRSLKNFLRELPPVIDMHILKGPVIAQGIKENPGLSGFVIIDYSHISVHTFTKSQEAMVDIFSCKPFIKEKAIKATLAYFQTKKSHARIKSVYWE